MGNEIVALKSDRKNKTFQPEKNFQKLSKKQACK